MILAHHESRYLIEKPTFKPIWQQNVYDLLFNLQFKLSQFIQVSMKH